MIYQNPVDIGNRALQHCGVSRIASFAEDSLQAQEVAFCYDKLRQAELRRNNWVFSIRKAALRPIDTTTKFLKPELYQSSKTYALGAIVEDTGGILWQSKSQDNVGNAPGDSEQWDTYCGPLTVTPYDTSATTGYFAGELVYETPGDGTYSVFMSLQNSNTVDPATATTWDATVTYIKDQVVVRTAITYASLIDFNLNQDPASAPALWDAGTTYGAAATVGGSDGLIYSSIAGANTGHDPTTSIGFWTNTGVLNPWTTINPFGAAGITWLALDVALQDLLIVYPIGSGPAMQSVTRNIYRLPANFLRKAPQDPKAGSVSYLGAPTGIQYTDWNLEGKYIVTREVRTIVLRFAADITNVSEMDPMFCEGLAARIAEAVVERLTQSTAKLAAIALAYKQVMGDARTVNGIEVGAIEPELDEYVTCRT